MSLLTGCRTEEARALTWDHVFLDATPPYVAVWGGSARQHRDTKTKKVPADAAAIRDRGRCLRSRPAPGFSDTDAVNDIHALITRAEPGDGGSAARRPGRRLRRIAVPASVGTMDCILRCSLDTIVGCLLQRLGSQ